jgi:hypothetical protein
LFSGRSIWTPLALISVHLLLFNSTCAFSSKYAPEVLVPVHKEITRL